MKNKITGIMACDPRGVIGVNGVVPWRIVNELRHFQKTTRGQLVIMGRKTYDEMSKLNLLTNRDSIVFTRNKDMVSEDESVQFVHSIDEFNECDLPDDKEIYLVGGGQIVRLFLEKNMVERFLLSHIHEQHKGDTIFPLEMLDHWKKEIISEHKEYTIYEYNNNN